MFQNKWTKHFFIFRGYNKNIMDALLLASKLAKNCILKNLVFNSLNALSVLNFPKFRGGRFRKRGKYIQ